MAIGVAGNYLLRLKFGSNEVPISGQMMEEFYIIQDMKQMLPSIRMRLVDSTGGLTHIAPLDREMSTVSVQFGNSADGGVDNEMDFNIYRTHPEALVHTQSIFDADGLLDVPGVFNPDFCRAYNAPVRDIVTRIALEEMLMDKVDISPALNVPMKVIQPRWSNMQLFRYLKSNYGDAAGYCFMPFVYVKNTMYTMAFKSLEEMTMGASVQNFVIGDNAVQDYLPVYHSKIINNQRLFGVRGIKAQQFCYFDYAAGAFVNNYDTYESYLSLSDYISIDKAETTDSQTIDDCGRTNEFTQTFGGKVRARYYMRINDLCKMWIETYGLPNMVPGAVVKVVFPQGLQTGDLGAYQWAGYWLVERVVHSFGATFGSKLLLTRAGVDTDMATSLLPAVRVS